MCVLLLQVKAASIEKTAAASAWRTEKYTANEWYTALEGRMPPVKAASLEDGNGGAMDATAATAASALAQKAGAWEAAAKAAGEAVPDEDSVVPPVDLSKVMHASSPDCMLMSAR